MRRMQAWLWLLAGALAAGPATSQEAPLKFGPWRVHHLHDNGADSSQAVLLTDAGFIAVECRRPGPATLMVQWTPSTHLGSPDDYTPREVMVRWDGERPQAEPWEAFVGAAFRRDDAYARRFAEALSSHARLTLTAQDAAGRPVQSVFDLGAATHARAAMERLQEDCRYGWH